MNQLHQPLTACGARDLPGGYGLLTNSLMNKGTAFTDHEQDLPGLRGLLPPRVFTIGRQVRRAMRNLRSNPNPLEKFIFLSALQQRNETL